MLRTPWRICSVFGSLALLVWTAYAPSPAAADEESPRLAQYRQNVDRAVDTALMFLARAQAENPTGDGSFADVHGQTNAVAGLVGMAFLSKGYRPGSPPYGDVINRSIDYILATETQNGYLGVRGDRMYGHGIATLFLSEVSGTVDPERQKRIDALLPKALRVILDTQQIPKERAEDRGGWRYEPTSNDSDISVTGWQLMALRSARLNGASVPASAIEEAIGFIDKCRSRDNDGGFWYTPPRLMPGGAHPFRDPWWSGGPSEPGRTGVALLCRELSGRHGDEVNRRAGEFILKSLQERGFAQWVHSQYAIYYCAQAMFQLGGASWEQFALAMYKHLLATQDQDGPWRTQDQGDVYPTAMYVLALGVSYRQLPIYQR